MARRAASKIDPKGPYILCGLVSMDSQMKALAHSHAVRSCEGLSASLQPTGPEVYEAGGFVVQLWCARNPSRRASSWPALDVPLQEAGWHASL